MVYDRLKVQTIGLLHKLDQKSGQSVCHKLLDWHLGQVVRDEALRLLRFFGSAEVLLRGTGLDLRLKLKLRLVLNSSCNRVGCNVELTLDW